jgi:flagellin
MNVLTATSASQAINTIDGALANINNSQAALGAYQNRFTSVMAVQASTIQNLTTAQSRIQDADFAQETANLSRSQVLQQAGTAMLAQANQSSQGVLSLLR